VLSLWPEHQVIDISSDTAFKIKFMTMPLPEFSICVENWYNELSEKAMHILILFVSSSLYELRFSFTIQSNLQLAGVTVSRPCPMRCKNVVSNLFPIKCFPSAILYGFIVLLDM